MPRPKPLTHIYDMFKSPEDEPMVREYLGKLGIKTLTNLFKEYNRKFRFSSTEKGLHLLNLMKEAYVQKVLKTQMWYRIKKGR